MQNEKKVYGALATHGIISRNLVDHFFSQGFTIALYEYDVPIRTLWDTVKGTNIDLCALPKFTALKSSSTPTPTLSHLIMLWGSSQRMAVSTTTVAAVSSSVHSIHWVSTYVGPVASTVWSNFEIADLDFWRSEPYMKFFEFLDSTGGFYYEVCMFLLPVFLLSHYVTPKLWLIGALFAQRWGDAPVHSLGVALLAQKDQIHFFNDIGEYILPMPFTSFWCLSRRA